MDPQVALEGFLGAVQAGDDDAADEYHEALSMWLRGGGFPPKWQPHEKRLYMNYRKEEAT